MREALFGGASGASSLFDEIAKNVVVNEPTYNVFIYYFEQSVNGKE